MTRARLIWRSVVCYWTTHAAVVGGTAVGAAVIVGALIVGDSVEHSLQQMARARLGQVHLALAPPDRTFRDALAAELATDLGTEVAAVLVQDGLAVKPDSSARANGVRVLGIDAMFWALASEPSAFGAIEPDDVFLSEALADQLEATPGDHILLRVEKPGTLPQDVPLAVQTDTSVALRARVRGIVPDSALGRFSLFASQLPPYNAFVSRAWLQQRLQLDAKANLLLVGPGATVGEAAAQLNKRWRLADAELRLLPRDGEQGSYVELRSRRIFIDQSVTGAITDAQPIMTYFVNELRVGTRATPYSMVTALDPVTVGEAIMPHDMAGDEIVINQWLAEDLQAQVGDELTMTYFVIDRAQQLAERSNRMRIRKVVPMTGLAADRHLMPDFPGLADADHCREWEPGVPIDVERIREKDEQYWQDHRGTPKAFVTVAAAQGHLGWQNRFGSLTAMRFPHAEPTKVERDLLQVLSPKMVGLRFEDVHERARRAGAKALDFGQLFLGLSFFLVVGALLLTALLFVFGIEHRSGQVGLLLALGWTGRSVRRLFLWEGAVLAAIGSLVGGAAGWGYTHLVLKALATVWRDAVAAAPIEFHAEVTSLVLGTAMGFVTAMAAVGLTLRGLGREAPSHLLAHGLTSPVTSTGGQGPRWSLRLALLSLFASVALVVVVDPQSSQAKAGVFFGVGSLVLLAGLCCVRAWLSTANRTSTLTLFRLSVSNAKRRRGRSLTTAALLACGVFLVVAVGANRLSVPEVASERSSGTGGFALFAQSAVPLSGKLAKEQALEELGEVSPDQFALVPMRVLDGDDASCLNLNRAQQPRLVGVQPLALQSRNAFQFAAALDQGSPGWGLLNGPVGPDDPIPAIADQATVVWALGKKLGDTIAYTDGRGSEFHVQIVGMLANSILQGSIFISEEAFVRRFPLSGGYQMFLVDAPDSAIDQARRTLSRSFEDVGMQVTPTLQRLAAFNAVQNTYLTIYQVLGAIGLVLASCGLAMVVMRNVLERQGELALQRALGFTRARLYGSLCVEHGLLLLAGLGCGAIAAVVAVAPVAGTTAGAPWLTATLLTLFGVLLAGTLWILLAARAALSGSFLEALRRE